MLLLAVGAAAAAWPLRATWWGGWILAIAEAGIVGGLADWFAVTALFRRPLGLPIPHTALIPANWELMAARVGSMVGDRVLTKEYLAAEIERQDLAGPLARAAGRLSQADLEAAIRRVAQWAAIELPRSAVDDLVRWGRGFLAGRPVAPLLVWALDTARREGWDQRVVQALAQSLGDAMSRPAFRRAVEALVGDLLTRYREHAGSYPRFWMGLAELLGVIDRDRIVAALHEGLRQVAADPEHPLRHELLAALAELPRRLESDRELAARVEAAGAELFASEAATRLLEDAALALHQTLVADLSAADSEVVHWIVDRLEAKREALIEDPAVRQGLEAWVKRHAVLLVERHHSRIAAFVEGGIRALGPAGAVRLIEEHAGDDLQFIRVNGTLVGGLAGGALYALHLLLR